MFQHEFVFRHCSCRKKWILNFCLFLDGHSLIYFNRLSLIDFKKNVWLGSILTGEVQNQLSEDKIHSGCRFCYNEGPEFKNSIHIKILSIKPWMCTLQTHRTTCPPAFPYIYRVVLCYTTSGVFTVQTNASVNSPRAPSNLKAVKQHPPSNYSKL